MDFYENDFVNFLYENLYIYIYIRVIWYNMYNNNYYKLIYIALNYF